MKRTLSQIFLASAIGLASIGGITQTQAAPSIDIQSVLQQERAWAGMETKRIKVGDIDWAYSEGGQAGKPTLLLVHGLAGS